MDIVLLVLDTARGDITNSLINDGELPNLATLAKGGQYYTNARANGPWTVPSHGTIFTGEYPSENGIHGNDPTYEQVPLVAELRDRGYETGGFSANPWLGSDFDFDQEFDYFCNEYDYYINGASMADVVRSSKDLKTRIKRFVSEADRKSIPKSIGNASFYIYQRARRQDSGGKYLLSRTGRWLSNRSNRPKFAFINITEPHLSYEIPNKWLPNNISQDEIEDVIQDPADYNAGLQELSEADCEILTETYTATLRYIDDCIEYILDRARENTTFIIIGDHGEHFGEYNRFGHQYSLHKELLHVPLIINGPTVENQVIRKPVELKELYDVILSFSQKKPMTLSPTENHFAEIISPRPSFDQLTARPSSNPRSYVHRYSQGARCIIKRKYKLIEFPNGEKRLFENGSLQEDPPQNIVDSLSETIGDKAGEIEAESNSELDLSDSVTSRLDDLGYV
ncbi:sulfatase-like hydrolase/transferase [Haloarcula hispanica]|nr:sulfatase-like hydrolase/transferase [Haloarcula hispanica]